MLLGAAYGSVSDIEVMWTLIAAVGLAFSLYNMREATSDAATLRERGIANGRRILATTNVLAESARLAKQTIFLLIGIVAMFLPEVANSADLPTVQMLAGIFIKWGLIVASLLTTFQSYLGFRARRLLR
jgi:hypothetical protein